MVRRLLVVSAFSVLLLGCGGGVAEPPEFVSNLVPTTGVVMVGTEPLSGAQVTFIPVDEKGERASGTTDAQGKFELHTPISGAPVEDTVGAVPGKYKVTVSHILMADGTPIPKEMTEADAMAMDARESVPSRFSDPVETELTEEISTTQSGLIEIKIPK